MYTIHYDTAVRNNSTSYVVVVVVVVVVVPITISTAVHSDYYILYYVSLALSNTAASTKTSSVLPICCNENICLRIEKIRSAAAEDGVSVMQYLARLAIDGIE